MASCNKKNILDAQAIAEKDPFSTRNNIRVTAAYADGSGEGELTITPECLNPRGAVHGGCLATLANAVSGWVAGAVQHCNSAPASYTLNFLRPAMGTNQKIRCRATPEKTGRTLSVYHVSLTDDEGLEVATGNFTFFMMDKRLNGTTPERLERTADES